MKRIIILLFIILFFIKVYSQSAGIYKINKIDSVTLSYNYLIKISPITNDSISINLLSDKYGFTNKSKQKIEIGKSYYFKLESVFEIINKNNNHDSVSYSPALMRSVVINGEVLITSSYKVHPFSTVNLAGLYYIEEKQK